MIRSTKPACNAIGQSGRKAGLPFVLFRYISASVVLASFLMIPVWCLEAGQKEFRGLWIVRHTLARPDRVIEAIETAHRTNINAVFVQVRGRGDAYYESTLVPGPDDLAPLSFDPLALVIQEAHQRGLEVHAWVNVYLTWHPTDRVPSSPNHLLNRHPEWFMTSADGINMGSKVLGQVDLVRRGVEGRYLSPGVPEVREHIVRVVRELVERYDIDGIHLDYVRYPNVHYDYNLINRAEFSRRYGFDPKKVVDGEPHLGESLEVRRRKVWEKWRTDQVTMLVEQIRDTISKMKPRVQLSAAVKPEIERAYRQHGQDWIRWINREMIDFVVPMFYTGSVREIECRMRDTNQYVKRGRMFAGIGMYNQRAKESIAQVKVARNAGLDGIVLYSYDSIIAQSGLSDALKQRLFANPTQTPLRKWKPDRAPETRQPDNN